MPLMQVEKTSNTKLHQKHTLEEVFIKCELRVSVKICAGTIEMYELRQDREYLVAGIEPLRVFSSYADALADVQERMNVAYFG